MTVLHMMCRRNGTVRMMVNRMPGLFGVEPTSFLLTDDNAQETYETVLAHINVDKIAVRVWNGSGWIRPWFDLGERYEERVLLSKVANAAQ
jgi:hypothetical protein